MLRSIFVFSLLAMGVTVGFFSRFAALLTYLWFALFRPQEYVWFDISNLHLSLVLGLLLVIPALVTGILPNLSHPISIGSILYLAIAASSYFGAVNQNECLYWLDLLSKLVLVCLFFTRLVDTPRRFAIATAVIAASFSFYSAKAGLAYLIMGGARFMAGTAGAFSDSNAYALGIVMIIPLLWLSALLLKGTSVASKVIRIGFLAAIPLSVMAIIGTFSRGAIIGFLAMGCTFIAVRRSHIRLALVACSLLGAASFLPIPAGYAERILTIKSYREVEDTSSLSRLHFWQVAYRMVQDRPLGVGLKNFESAYDTYDFKNGEFGHARAVHNSHLEVLADLGYPGAAIWVLLFLLSFAYYIKIRRRSCEPGLSSEHKNFLSASAAALISSQAGFLVGGMFIAMSLNDLTWLCFAMFACLDLISRKIQKGELQKEVPNPPDSKMR
jgi:putative inorganic carbon (hco3(-)) transporter